MATNENISYLPNEQVTSPPVSRRTKALGWIAGLSTVSLTIGGALEKNPDLGGTLISVGLASGITFATAALFSEIIYRQKTWSRGRSLAVRE